MSELIQDITWRLCQSDLSLTDRGLFNQCKQALTAAEQEIAELKQRVPVWVPVSERLPDDLSEPHIYGLSVSSLKTGTSWFESYVCWIGDDGIMEGCDAWEFEYFTHWMPLPSPPLPQQDNDQGMGEVTDKE